MAFQINLLIPALTTEADPAVYILPIVPMRINHIDLTFPSGCVGLVGVWFEYQSIQIYPYNRDGRFKGDGQTIRIAPMTELVEPPWELVVKGYNNDDTFDHTIYVVVDATFIDKKGGIATNIIDALAELFAIKGR